MSLEIGNPHQKCKTWIRMGGCKALTNYLLHENCSPRRASLGSTTLSSALSTACIPSFWAHLWRPLLDRYRRFNVIINASNKLGGKSYTSTSFSGLEHLVNIHGLVDLNFFGAPNWCDYHITNNKPLNNWVIQSQALIIILSTICIMFKEI